MSDIILISRVVHHLGSNHNNSIPLYHTTFTEEAIIEVSRLNEIHYKAAEYKERIDKYVVSQRVGDMCEKFGEDEKKEKIIEDKRMAFIEFLNIEYDVLKVMASEDHYDKVICYKYEEMKALQVI